MLSLSTAKSGALIGVLISVTTIPAAANVGVSAAYRDWSAMGGSAAQLGINLGSIIVSGTAVLDLQRGPLRAAQGAPRRRQGPRHTDEPSDDQISTFVLTFSITASVNSVVVAWPPRSIVFMPPAVVSSVPS